MAEIPRQKPVEKVAVSPEWTDAERLKVVGLIAQDLADAFSPQERKHLLLPIQLLVSGNSAFLENNRQNFAEYISDPSNA